MRGINVTFDASPDIRRVTSSKRNSRILQAYISRAVPAWPKTFVTPNLLVPIVLLLFSLLRKALGLALEVSPFAPLRTLAEEFLDGSSQELARSFLSPEFPIRRKQGLYARMQWSSSAIGAGTLRASKIASGPANSNLRSPQSHSSVARGDKSSNCCLAHRYRPNSEQVRAR